MKNKSILVLSLIITALILIAGCTPTTSITGIIEVNSTPTGAKIYLDGVDTGMATPFTITSVEVGSHVIKLDAFHYKIWEDTVIVIANKTTYLNLTLVSAPEETKTLQPGLEGIDGGVVSLFPDNNYGNFSYCAVGNNATTKVRTYIKFDLSTVPADAVVVDAYLKLYQYDTLGIDDFTIGLYKVTRTWDVDTIDWDNQPTCSVDAEITIDITVGATIWKSWDIDTLVQGWLDGTITNYGMMLKDTDEASVNTIAYFYTSDYTIDTSKRPELVIGYYVP